MDQCKPVGNDWLSIEARWLSWISLPCIHHTIQLTVYSLFFPFLSFKDKTQETHRRTSTHTTSITGGCTIQSQLFILIFVYSKSYKNSTYCKSNLAVPKSHLPSCTARVSLSWSKLITKQLPFVSLSSRIHPNIKSPLKAEFHFPSRRCVKLHRFIHLRRSVASLNVFGTSNLGTHSSEIRIIGGWEFEYKHKGSRLSKMLKWEWKDIRCERCYEVPLHEIHFEILSCCQKC